MGFSDAATPVLWVGNIKAGLQQKDVMQVFSRQARLAAPCRAGSPLCALWIACPQITQRQLLLMPQLMPQVAPPTADRRRRRCRRQLAALSPL